MQEAHAKGMKVVFQFPLGENEQQVIDSMKWWIKEVDLDASYVIHSEKIACFWDDVQKICKDKERFSSYDKRR